MKDVLYAPVCCARCNRTSVVVLSKSDLRRRLDDGASVELRCAFDDACWAASTDERIRLGRLLIENAKVERSTALRLRETPSDTWSSARS